MDKPVLLLMPGDKGIKIERELFPLEKSPVKVGRDSMADLRLPDPFISRAQAELFSEDGKWFIRDEKSKNGTFVNGMKIGAGKVTLKQDDVISFSKKIDFLFRENDWEEGETRSISTLTDKYGIRMDEKTRDVYVDDIKLDPPLSIQEWDFLSVLVNEPDRIHSYKELAKRIINISEEAFIPSVHTPKLHSIKNEISRKLRRQGICRKVIKSRSNDGYLLMEKETQSRPAEGQNG